MQLKKFTARTVKEAMGQVRKELGLNAVILKTTKINNDASLDKTLENGVFEIIAAVDSAYDNVISGNGVSVDTKQNNKRISNSFYYEASKIFPEVDYDQKNANNKSSVNLPENNKIEDNFGLRKQFDLFLSEIDKKISERLSAQKISYEQIAPQLRTIQKEIIETRKIINKYSGVSYSAGNNVMPEVCVRLVDQEVEQEIVGSIARNMDQSILNENPDSSDRLINYMDKLVSKISKYSGGIEFDGVKPKVMALVGPTGVGKTTTIAKLAADVSLTAHKKVALFTIDTYRIGAQEQLKTYCDILELPIEVIRSPYELNEKLKSHSDKDLILIDTIGRGSYDLGQIKNMSEFLSGSIFPIEIHLVLSAVTKWSDLKEMAMNFRNFDVSCLLFTKLDETKRYGNLFNLAVRTQLPISYVTIGQNVPEDIEIMSSRLMSDLLIGRVKVSVKETKIEFENLATV